MNRFFLVLLMLCCTFSELSSQKTKLTKDERISRRLERDSVFLSKPYPYILPIWGNKVHERKIKFPLPFGIMFNSLVVKQILNIDRINVGFGQLGSGEDPVMYDLSKIVKFNEIAVQTSTFNMRADVYLFPFLNIYGIFGKTKQANINIDMVKPFPMAITTDVNGWYIGYGAMLQGKIGPVFLSLDGNQNYNHNPRVDKPVLYSMGSFRAGPVFGFRNNPNMKLVVWVGAMYSHFNGETLGTINASNLAPNAPQKIGEMHQSLDDWYSGLGNLDKIKYKLIYNELGKGLDLLANGVNNTYIRYDLNKTTNRPWNMVTGVQWQIDDHWQTRVEAQYLGDRTAGLFSINYRFGIKGRTLFSKKSFNDAIMFQ